MNRPASADFQGYRLPPREREGTRREAPGFVDFGDILRLLWRRKLLILFITLSFIVAAFLVLQRLTPVYLSEAEVILDARETRVVNAEQTVVEDLIINDAAVASEIAVITSNVLIGRVVDDLGLVDHPEFAYVPPDEPDWRIAVDNALARGLAAIGIAAPPEDPVSLDVAELSDRTRVIKTIQNRLSVYQQGISYVIAIAFRAEDPALAALVTNTLAETYIDRQLQDRVEATQGAAEWLTERVGELRENVGRAEAAVVRRRGENLALGQGEMTVITDQLQGLSDQLTQARADRLAAEARYEQVSTTLERDGPEAAADLVTTALVDRLRGDLSDLNRQLGQFETRFGPSHSSTRQVLAEISAVEASLAAEVRNFIARSQSEAEIAAARTEMLEQTVRDVEQRIVALEAAQIELNQLEREADAIRVVYQQLLIRLNEARAQQALGSSNARLVSRAELPEDAYRPRPKVLLASGGFMGLTVGVGLVFLLELLNKVFRSREEISGTLGLPVMAAAPLARYRNHASVLSDLAENPYSELAERVRQLRTSLLQPRDGREPTKVMITSTGNNEGKTATALALGYMTRLTGKKVLVVDADLRFPELTGALGIEPAADIGAVLRGAVMPEDAIVTVPRYDFDVLPCAGSDADTADSLSSETFQQLLDYLAGEYELILIDTPPVLTVADAYAIGRGADATLYLVRAHHTQRTDAANGVDTLASLGVSVAGVLMTT